MIDAQKIAYTMTLWASPTAVTIDADGITAGGG
jgi:hypothetical protein